MNKRPKWSYRVKRWNLINNPVWIKLWNWEYWPTLAFYWPMFVYGPLLALRSRHACFFTAANPGILAGGLGLESKYATIQNLPASLCPKSILAPRGQDLALILEEIRQVGIEFPLIAKPDVGYRGFLVKKLETPDQLRAYLSQYPIDFIIQEYLNYPEELGVLYYRLPNAEKGKITSLTLKDFLHVTGDGKSTVLELIEKTPRALLQLDRLQETHWQLFKNVPLQGERVGLGVIGNHSKGTQFINGNQHIDDSLHHTFDTVAKQIPGFSYGRFDIKCTSLEDLKQGKNFKIIELNGVCSEPTHIYDQSLGNYFRAVGTIMQHWTIVRKVAAANHRKGAAYMPEPQMIKMLTGLRDYHQKIKAALKVE